jgi:hypothetical protein
LLLFKLLVLRFLRGHQESRRFVLRFGLLLSQP